MSGWANQGATWRQVDEIVFAKGSNHVAGVKAMRKAGTPIYTMPEGAFLWVSLTNQQGRPQEVLIPAGEIEAVFYPVSSGE